MTIQYDSTIMDAKNMWTTPSSTVNKPASSKQREWDEPICKIRFAKLLEESNLESQTRLQSAATSHSFDWLNTVPITTNGLNLSDEEFRVATSLRLGIDIYATHVCICVEQLQILMETTVSVVNATLER